MKNILHLIETTGPGGAETVLLNIVKNLDPERFRSIAGLFGGGWLRDNLEKHSIPVIQFSKGKAYDWKFIRDAIEVVKENKIDLIHSHLSGMNLYSCLVGLICRKPVIVTFHGKVGDWDKKSLKNKIKFFIIKIKARYVVTVSDYLKMELIKTWNFAGNKILRIYNGVDFEHFDSVQQQSNVRKELGIGDTTSLICMVGNIRKSKGYDYFISAAKIVSGKYPDCLFIIAGQGKGLLLDDLVDFIKKLNLKDKVRLLGFRDDIPGILRQSNIFVLSSLTEGLSIATIEAMGMGKPVVVTDSGGPGEIVENGRTGFLVPPGDTEALAGKICLLLENRNLADSLGLAAGKTVRLKFGLKQNIDSYTKLYEKCLF